MIILAILTDSLMHFFLGGWSNVLLGFWSERVKVLGYVSNDIVGEFAGTKGKGEHSRLSSDHLPTIRHSRVLPPVLDLHCIVRGEKLIHDLPYPLDL